MATFDDFWAVYPRRIAKLDAKRKWEAATKVSPAAEIIDGAKRYAAFVAGRDPRYVKHPSTWLHGGGWMDELPDLTPQRQLTRAEQLQEDLRRRILDEQANQDPARDRYLEADERLPSLAIEHHPWRH